MCVCLYQKSVCKVYRTQGELNRRRGDWVSVQIAVTFLDCWRTSVCVTTIIKIVNNNTKDKQTSGASPALDEDSPYTNSCMFIRSAAFVIVVTQKLVLQQSKNVTAKCAETQSPPPSIQFSLTEPKVCTVVLYSTYESRYLYSLGKVHLFMFNCLIYM